MDQLQLGEFSDDTALVLRMAGKDQLVERTERAVNMGSRSQLADDESVAAHWS